MQPSSQRLSDAVSRRLGVDRADVDTAIERLTISLVAVGRLTQAILSSASWPEVPLTGKTAFELNQALISAGVPVPVVACVRCNEIKAIYHVEVGGASCRSCGPQGTVVCPAGKHSMSLASRSCTECRDLEVTAVVTAAVVALGIEERVAKKMVLEALTTYLQRISAAKWIMAGGSFSDEDPGAASMQRLRRALAERGLVASPKCAKCREIRDLRYQTDAGRICTRCFTSQNVATCVNCRKVRPVGWRDPGGQPWCGICRRDREEVKATCVKCGHRASVAMNSPDGPVGSCCYETPAEMCAGCGEVRPVWTRRDGVVLCRTCFGKPIAPCLRCGERRRIPKNAVRGRVGWCVKCCRVPLVDGDEGALVRGGPCIDCGRPIRIHAYLPDGPRCGRCYGIALNRRGHCEECGTYRRLFFWPGRCADCLGINIGHVCSTCGLEANLYANERCSRCELAARLDDELGEMGEDATRVSSLLKSTSSPEAALRLLAKSPAWKIVTTMLDSGHALSHERLDDACRAKESNGNIAKRLDVEFARSLFISAGALPLRSERAFHFQRWADEALDAVKSSEDRWIVRRFCQERLLPTVEHQDRMKKSTTGTTRWAQARLRAAIHFVEWMAQYGGLRRLNRKQLDEWLSGPTSRFNIRDFVRWAARQDFVNLPLAAMPKRVTRSPAEAVDYDDRAALAQSLLFAEHFDSSARVAGLLVVLFGQHLSRIVKLTALQVRHSPTRLQLGKEWIEIPQPMDSFVEELERSALSEPMARLGQPWLFPGNHPGEHLSEDAIGRRLAKIGIRSRAMRNAALFQLASNVEPHTLYKLLGLHPNTAVAWGRVAGNVYASYWSDLRDDELEVDLEDDEDLEEGTREHDVLSELGLIGDAESLW